MQVSIRLAEHAAWMPMRPPKTFNDWFLRMPLEPPRCFHRAVQQHLAGDAAQLHLECRLRDSAAI